jgi:predicted nucleic acid-binding Zn ribbon protein
VCGKDALHKVFTPVGIVFKGSGFYSTDHRGSSARSGSSNGKGETKADAGTEAKPETKPAPPTPPKED